MVTKTLNGPNGLRLVLDSREIFPDEPGAGTPAMVHLGRDSATYWCAANEGEVDMEKLSDRQCAWLWEQENLVAEFIEANSPK